MFRTLLVSTIALSLSAGQVAIAQEADLQGKPTTSAFSGKSAAQKRTLSKAGSGTIALSGILAGERSDDPCFLRASFRDIVSGAESTLSYDECRGNERDLEALSMPVGGFVTGVRVCLNGADEKIKGVQLIGNYGACVLGAEHTYVVPAGCSSVFKTSGMEYRLCNTDSPSLVMRSCAVGIKPHFERNNCPGTKQGPDGDWKRTVECAPGKVATGVTLNHRSGGGDRRMVSGIALECTDLASS